MRRLSMLSFLFAVGCASGGVSQAVKQDLQKTIEGNEEPIALCYQEALRANAALEGEIVLKFEVDEGKKELTNVKVDRTTIEEPGLEQCIIQETSELSLSRPPEAKLAVTYPLAFKKTEE